ncbi:MAG: hypothetical protein FJ215_09685 [Ignavibacteria bacterium]|nr:hypothetical protein [Ignavibacteria bacterium]
MIRRVFEEFEKRKRKQEDNEGELCIETEYRQRKDGKAHQDLHGDNPQPEPHRFDLPMLTMGAHRNSRARGNARSEASREISSICTPATRNLVGRDHYWNPIGDPSLK